jgi:hypothetical protein
MQKKCCAGGRSIPAAFFKKNSGARAGSRYRPADFFKKAPARAPAAGIDRPTSSKKLRRARRRPVSTGRLLQKTPARSD